MKWTMGAGIACLLMSGVSVAQVALDSEILAERSGTKVTVGDMRAKVRVAVAAEQRANYFADGERTALLVDGMLLNNQLVAMAKAAGMDQEPAIKEEIQVFIEDLLARKYMSRHLDSVADPDFEALTRERYKISKADYVLPPKRDVRHILIMTARRSPEDAKKKANEVYALLKQGKDFDEVLKEHSEDPAKSLNGWVRDVVPSKFDPAFVKATWGLKKEGDISEPVESQFGYHIIRLEKETPKHQRSYEEVHDELLSSLKTEYATSKREAYIEELKASPMTLHRAAIEKLQAIENP